MKIVLEGFDSFEKSIIQKVATDYSLNFNFSDQDPKNNVVISIRELDEKPWKIGYILDFLEKKTILNEKREDISFKNYFLSAKDRFFQCNKQKIYLNEREYEVMRLLFLAKEEGCSRESLLHAIWEYRPDLETHVVETQIYRLRQKIEKQTERMDIIATIDGGYRLD